MSSRDLTILEGYQLRSIDHGRHVIFPIANHRLHFRLSWYLEVLWKQKKIAYFSLRNLQSACGLRSVFRGYLLTSYVGHYVVFMGLLPDTLSRGFRMRWECRERFSRHRLPKEPLVSDPGLHHGTCVTHVPWCMSGSLTPGGGENVPGIPGAFATHNITYLARGPCI